MRSLIAPAHYLFSDKYGSEPLWSVEIVSALANKVENIDVIVGVNEVQRALPANIVVHALFSSRSTNPAIEFIRRSLFYFLVTFKAMQLMTRNTYSVVHHLLPFSLATFNPTLLVARFFNPKVRTVLGPVQAPYASANIADLDIALIGRKSNKLMSWFLQSCYLTLIIPAGWLSKLMLRGIDYLVCTSDLAWNYYRQFTNVKHAVIPPFISVPHLSGKSGSAKPIILCVAALVNRKGHKYLLEAVQLLNQTKVVQLVLVGDGPERKNLEAQARNMEIADKVKFVGNLSRDKVMPYYSKATVLCLPSVEDSFPTVLIEAMAYGLPSVTTDVGSAREIVGRGGLVVAKENSGQLAESLGKILFDKSLQQFLTKQALERYQTTYSETGVTSKYMTVYGKNPQ